MAFAEALKAKVRKRAHLICCLCKSVGVEVHHIVPQEEHGADTEDNAAPLCPSCHETYGANPQKRKFIREARDLWYEICEKRYASDPERLDEIQRLLKNAVSRDDFAAFKDDLLRQMRSSPQTKQQSDAARNDLLSERLTEQALFSVQTRASVERAVTKIWSRFTGVIDMEHPIAFTRKLADLKECNIVPNELLDAAKEVYTITSCVLHDVSITPEQWRFVCAVAPELTAALYEQISE